MTFEISALVTKSGSCLQHFACGYLFTFPPNSSTVITELPPNNAKTYLEALCYPVVSPLQVIFISRVEQLIYTFVVDETTDFVVENQEIVNQGPEVLNKKPARELTVHIDRFAYIFRCVLYPISMSLFSVIWNVL